MSRRPLLALAAATVVVSALPAPASAATIALHCEPGRYCMAIAKEKGQIRLRLLLQTRMTRYRLCVTPPDRSGATRSCKTFRVREVGGVRGSDVRWSSHFPNEGRGVYKVRWMKADRTLGKVLSFRRG